MGYLDIVEWSTRAVEIAGIVIIVVGATVSTVQYVGIPGHHQRGADAYLTYRQGLGRAILLGLEFLVAADIIHTIAISPTFTSVGVLAGIVAIRTFLSFTLELEIDGRWPWQPRAPSIREAEPERPLPR